MSNNTTNKRAYNRLSSDIECLFFRFGRDAVYEGLANSVGEALELYERMTGGQVNGEPRQLIVTGAYGALEEMREGRKSGGVVWQTLKRFAYSIATAFVVVGTAHLGWSLICFALGLDRGY